MTEPHKEIREWCNGERMLLPDNIHVVITRLINENDELRTENELLTDRNNLRERLYLWRWRLRYYCMQLWRMR